MIGETVAFNPVDPDMTRPQSDAECDISARHSGPSIPGFRIHDMLGHGGMGVVYKATQVKLQRTVALKMMLSGQAAGSRELVRFLAEVEAMARIDHPHVVRIYESGDIDGKPYFAMELLTGGSLNDRLAQQGRLTPIGSAELLRKLALAIQAAHDCQIVHRDLKPANILFDSIGEPRITDFGLAKKGDIALTATNAILGTPAYMAPEQARGESKYVGPQADIWALGVVLYECLTAEKPFSGSNEIEILRKVVEEEPDRVRSRVTTVPKELELIVQKCLAKDSLIRYGSAKALAEDLRRWIAGEPVSVKAASMIERGVKWIRRNRLAAGIIAATVVAVIVTGMLAAIAFEQRNAARSFASRADDETGKVVKAIGLLQQQGKEQRYLLDVLRIKDALDAHNDGFIEFAKTSIDDVHPDNRTAIWYFARRRTYEDDIGLMTIVSLPIESKEKTHAANPNSPFVASKGTGHTIAIHFGSRLDRELVGHEDEVTCLAWSPDGRILASGSRDRSIRLWNLTTGSCTSLKWKLDIVLDLAWSPCGRTLAAAQANGVILLWDVSTAQAMLELRGHTGAVRNVFFGSNGSFMTSNGDDGTVRIWQAK